MAYFATPYGLRYAAHCFNRAHTHQRSSALIPAGGKIRGSRHSLEGGYRDAIRSESRGTILQVFEEQTC